MRTGSYPYRYIAQDFGVPYGVVLRYSDGVAAGLDVSQGAAQDCRVLMNAGVWAVRAADDIRTVYLLTPYARTLFHIAVCQQVNRG